MGECPSNPNQMASISNIVLPGLISIFYLLVRMYIVFVYSLASIETVS